LTVVKIPAKVSYTIWMEGYCMDGGKDNVWMEGWYMDGGKDSVWMEG
jgi:hypothetical protein